MRSGVAVFLDRQRAPMWPFRRDSVVSAIVSDDAEDRSHFTAPLLGLSNPAVAEYLGVTWPNDSGVAVTESTALTFSAVWCACKLIAGTIGTLPIRVIREVVSTGQRDVVPSWIENPAGPDSLTSLEWSEVVMWHLLLHGDAFLYHRYNGAGALAGLEPIHPTQVSVEWDYSKVGNKRYHVSLDDGTSLDLDKSTMTQIMGPSLDKLRGMSAVAAGRTSFGTAIAGDRAAARLFRSGALMSGLVTPEEDLEVGDVEKIMSDLRANALGYDKSGGFVVINRKLKVQPWAMSAADAQFLESRKFSIEEIARWFGVPPHLLMQTEKQTSWGTGVEEQNRGLRQFCLNPWTSRIEEKLTELIPRGQSVKYDYTELERPSADKLTDILTKQVAAGLVTPNEARRQLNLPPLAGGDALRAPEPTLAGSDASGDASTGPTLVPSLEDAS